MTVTDVLNYVRRLQNEFNSSSSFWSDEELYALIQTKSNEALNFLGLIEGLDSSQVTTASTADYNFPTDFIKIRRIRCDGRGLKYVPFRVYEARTPTGTVPAGTPREWTTWNNVITLIPTPDTSNLDITIYGEKQQSAITSPSSTIDIPAVFHGALCDAIISEMFLKDLNASLASVYSQKWLQFHIPNMRKFAARRRRRGSSIVIQDTDSLIETEFGLI